MMQAPHPNFTHLLSLSGPYGTFEHAEHARARVEHGYCTDDVARVLVVTARVSDPSREVGELSRSSLQFLANAQSSNGRFKNRRSASGTWHGRATAEDCWGRAVWALGTVMARSKDEVLVGRARAILSDSIQVRSRWPRAMAFATFGAAEVLRGDPANEDAMALVAATAKLLDRRELGEGWRWCEERLTYANAALPEAMIAAGSLVGNERLVQSGLRQLGWLLEMSSREGHLSVTPAQGRGRSFNGEKFDQQPIEVAALSEACLRASDVTGDAQWLEGHELAVRWFLGENDVGEAMFDALTGGGYDGLTSRGPNMNQGAESTVALLSTLQSVRRFDFVA